MDLIQNRENSVNLYFKTILSNAASVLCIKMKGMGFSLDHRVPGSGQTAPCPPQGLVRQLFGKK